MPNIAIPLPPFVEALLADPTTQKALATVGPDGSPHITVPETLLLADDGTLHYLEPYESSDTNRNLVRSIWFDGQVAITLKGTNGRDLHIRGTPVKVHITGPLFQKHYQAIRARGDDGDLAGVWVIRPDDVTEESPQALRIRERARHPDFIHLDRLAAIPGTAS